MKRVLCFALAALSLSALSATKRALLVGVGSYPDLKTVAKLDGTGTDLDKMRFLLKAFSFDPRQIVELREGTATRAAMIAEMSRLAKGAASKDEVVFYFTGRGSITPQLGTNERLPTLVPFDGKLANPDNDISMARLEEWAKVITDKGAHVTIIVDASYKRPFKGRGEDRAYKHFPKVFPRDGEPRKTLYRGSGAFIGATAASGNAYEAKLDTNADVWASAFTQDFVGAALMKLEQGGASYVELMGELQMYFAGQTEQGYMPGFEPFPEVSDMNAAYFKKAFSANSTPEPTDDQQAQIKVQNRQRREQEKKLRVAVDTEPGITGEERKKLLDATIPELDAYCGRKLERVRLLPKFVAGADRVIFVSKTDGKLSVRVTGDEVDESEQGTKRYEGANVADVMADGLGDYLQRQAYQLRLFRLADTEKPTLDAELMVRLPGDLAQFRVGDTISYEVTAGAESNIYLLDRDDSDGRVHMILPVKEETNNRVPSGKTVLPRDVEYEILPGTKPGRTRVLTLLVKPGKPLPSLRVPEARYAEAELKHLSALVLALESGDAKWVSHSLDYEVRR